MSVNLQKGQKIDLIKKDGLSLDKVMIGLGWDEVSQKGKGLFKKKQAQIDCDTSVILCDKNGKLLSGGVKKCCIYFGNTINENMSIVHQGDNLTGQGDGDDEQINISLSNIPDETDKLVFVVNIYKATERKQHFGLINNAFIRVVDTDNRTEICKYNLSDDYNNMLSVIIGEVYRRNGSWKFNAIGQGVTASNLSDLLKLYQ